MTTLHITNGDSVAGTLNEFSSDAVLPWRDVLHDGPVPGDVDAAALRAVRAQFLAERGWTSYDVVLADLTGRDAQLAAMGAGDEVVLWFEPDLYDQLQLMQILAQLYLKPAAARPTITIVSADELLGPLSKSELAKYIEKQRTVREVDLEIAAQGWEAFTSSDNTLLRQFAETDHPLFAANSYSADSSVVLPHMHGAIRRLLQEYPSEKNGLSRSEQQIVDVLMQGARTLGETYQQAHGPKEEWIWLGDWGFAWYVERLMSGASPLVEGVDGAGDRASFARRAQTDGAAFWNQKIRLTEAGAAVAAGTRNTLLLNGIDRWIGGVHLIERAVS
ncbi:MAG: DUF1835 domain-containing protein [Gemmatimonadaceae bacterium]